MNTRRARFLVLAASLVAALITAELAYRAALFSSNDRFRAIQDPGLHADPFSEDLYWKLEVAWSGEHPPPKRPHPLLGWVGSFSRETLRHRNTRKLSERRPVLLYGDSFAACFGEIACFEDILNADDDFANDHYLLNYGVGGYGLDQTYLLFRNSIEHFDRPFVVLSLFTYDLDRCLLSFRIGQKPRFRVAEGALELEPAPIYEDTADYLAENPPQATSYLFRRLVFSGLLPETVSTVLRGETESRRRKIAVGEAILSATLAELERRSLDFLFLVFHGDRPTDNPLFGGTDWRERFLRDWLEGHRVPYIWSKDVVARDFQNQDSSRIERYLDPETLHPTEHLNRLLAREIQERIRTFESTRGSIAAAPTDALAAH